MNTMPGPVRRAVTALSPCNFDITIIYTTFQRKLWLLEESCYKKAMHEYPRQHYGHRKENANTLYKRWLQPVSSLSLQHNCRLSRVDPCGLEFYGWVGSLSFAWLRERHSKGQYGSTKLLVCSGSQDAKFTPFIL